MSTSYTPGTHRDTPVEEPTLGALVHDLSEQTSALVRSEVELAKAELAAKGKSAGMGAGLFGAAGLLGFFAAAVLITTAILALDLALPAWLAALIVGVVLLAAAGIAALLGKKKVADAGSPVPERAAHGVKQDVATLKGGQA
ncbi:phage holin family protein [Nocardioides mesophilus]|uniref:Phage holin family protein n=1 Tax=Nocardioides mesophilus TaxID=433659 RepID=A0A7G9R7P4_9ACTN|nr:phage holin family protein [Nocardioides mesophilus]QNN51619.1 phage holin family protein [Nocardioides mesophilus]